MSRSLRHCRVNTKLSGSKKCKCGQANQGTGLRHSAKAGIVASKPGYDILSMMAKVKISFEYLEL
jgi:hypothetical protein